DLTQRSLGFGITFVMEMDELSTSDLQEQMISDDHLQLDIHIVYPTTKGYASCVERGASVAEAHDGYDLESGIMVSEPEGSSFLASARRLVGNVGGRLSFNQSVNGSVSGHTGNSGVQCEAPPLCAFQKKEVKLGFSEFAVSGFKKQGSQDLGLAKKLGNIVCVCADKIRHGNDSNALKPGWKKPPRPPRAATDPSREKHMKAISDKALLRRARLERMRSLRRHKVGKPSSTKTTVWALLFTVFFFAIVITQGIYSQGTVSPQDSSTQLVQTSSLSMHTLANDASKNESGQKLGLGEFLAPLSSPSGVGEYYGKALQLDEAS
ncbi:hypothetical protein KI387_017655, partial [Taxus chinensis]